MNTTTKKFAAVLTLTVLPVLGAAPALAFDGPAPAVRVMHGMSTVLMQVAGLPAKLDLTDEQKQEIKAILASHKDELAVLAAAEKTTRTALHTAIRQLSVNEKNVRQASAAVAKVDADLAVTRAQIYSEIYAVLTPDQRAELAAAIQEVQSSVASLIETLKQIFSGLF